MANIYKRGATYWIRFVANGKQIRKSAHTSKKAEAQTYLERVRTEYAAKARGDRPRYRLAEAVARYFEEASLKPRTMTVYRYISQNCLRIIGDIALDELDKKTLASFVGIRKRSGITDATIRRDLALLSSVCAMAVRWDWLGTNPVTAFSKRTLKESRARTRFLTREEFRRLHDCASRDLKPILIVAVETGMRKEELLSVTLDVIDFRRREIHLTNTKTSSPRRIPLSAKAMETICERLEDRDRPRSRYLFCKADGTRLGSVKTAFNGACRRAGIADFRFHDLRHTFASWFVQDGGDLYRLSRILGHTTLQMSSRYSHLRTDDLHDEMDRVAQKRSRERQIKRPHADQTMREKLPGQSGKPLNSQHKQPEIERWKDGAPERIRTSDPQIRSRII